MELDASNTLSTLKDIIHRYKLDVKEIVSVINESNSSKLSVSRLIYLLESSSKEGIISPNELQYVQKYLQTNCSYYNISDKKILSIAKYLNSDSNNIISYFASVLLREKLNLSTASKELNISNAALSQIINNKYSFVKSEYYIINKMGLIAKWCYLKDEKLIDKYNSIPDHSQDTNKISKEDINSFINYEMGPNDPDNRTHFYINDLIMGNINTIDSNTFDIVTSGSNLKRRKFNTITDITEIETSSILHAYNSNLDSSKNILYNNSKLANDFNYYKDTKVDYTLDYINLYGLSNFIFNITDIDNNQESTNNFFKIGRSLSKSNTDNSYYLCVGDYVSSIAWIHDSLESRRLAVSTRETEFNIVTENDVKNHVSSTIQIWNFDNDLPILELIIRLDVGKILFISSYKNTLIVASNDGHIRLYNIPTLSFLQSKYPDFFKSPKNENNILHISFKEQYDIEVGKKVPTYVVYSPETSYFPLFLAIGFTDGSISIYNFNPAPVFYLFLQFSSDSVTSLMFSNANPYYLAIGYQDGVVHIANLNSSFNIPMFTYSLYYDPIINFYWFDQVDPSEWLLFTITNSQRYSNVLKFNSKKAILEGATSPLSKFSLNTNNNPIASSLIMINEKVFLFLSTLAGHFMSVVSFAHDSLQYSDYYLKYQVTPPSIYIQKDELHTFYISTFSEEKIHPIRDNPGKNSKTFESTSLKKIDSSSLVPDSHFTTIFHITTCVFPKKLRVAFSGVAGIIQVKDFPLSN